MPFPGKIPLMWIAAALSGRAMKLNANEVHALTCAGLVMESPSGQLLAGWVQHYVIAAYSGMPITGLARWEDCSDLFASEHKEARQFAAFVIERIDSSFIFQRARRNEFDVPDLEELKATDALKTHAVNFAETWQTVVTASHPTRGASILRHPLPISIRDESKNIQVQQTVIGNRQRLSKSRQATELIKSIHQLTMLDTGSPDNGPVMWTIAYALLEKPSGFSMQLDELADKVTSYLGRGRDGYVRRIAQQSIFRQIVSADGLVSIQLDYSGRGESGWLQPNSNLSCSANHYRIGESWVVRVSGYENSDGEISLKLPLAVHLAVLARNLEMDPLGPSLPAVLVVGERGGWLYLEPELIAAAAQGEDPWIQFHDTGVIELRSFDSLSDMVDNYSVIEEQPIEMLRVLGELLGMRIPDASGSFPLPQEIRMWLKARGDEPSSIDEEIHDAAIQAQRQLEGDSDDH